MIDRIRLLALLDVIDCSCSDCMWEKVHDVMDAVELETRPLARPVTR